MGCLTKKIAFKVERKGKLRYRFRMQNQVYSGLQNDNSDKGHRY